MTNKQVDVCIIGAGLAGLTIAYLLKNTGHSVVILESRNRIGGRILTNRQEAQASLEMGATWLGKKHRHLLDLLKELEIEYFEQALGRYAIYEPISTSPHQLVHLPPNQDPSYRICGGTDQIIKALYKHIQPDTICCDQKVSSIGLENNIVRIESTSMTTSAAMVVTTIPPYLLNHTVAFHPPMSTEIKDVLGKTHTWMGESIKIGLTFESAFWRKEGYSGTVVSNVGPIPELYEHSSHDDRYHALIGFLNGAYFNVSKERRLELILHQLEKYYGPIVRSFQDYQEVVWRMEASTFKAYTAHVLPHQNNGHIVFRNAFWDGRLLLAGAETASAHPGYMDGAVKSAKDAVKHVIGHFS